MPTSVEEAIRTAIEFEIRVRDFYREAQRQVTDPVGSRVFGVLAEEEADHVAYLESRFQEWTRRGTMQSDGLKTAVPAKDTIDNAADKLEELISEEDRGDEIQMLSKALDVELETSDFYRRMVEELASDARTLFARFLEIEEGHVAIVRAELDYLTKTGYWFDFREFDFEGD
jgi:rubrerythrin